MFFTTRFYLLSSYFYSRMKLLFFILTILLSAGVQGEGGSTYLLVINVFPVDSQKISPCTFLDLFTCLWIFSNSLLPGRKQPWTTVRRWKSATGRSPPSGESSGTGTCQSMCSTLSNSSTRRKKLPSEGKIIKDAMYYCYLQCVCLCLCYNIDQVWSCWDFVRLDESIVPLFLAF